MIKKIAMQRFILLSLFFMGLSHVSFSQQNYYDVTPGDGYGIRLWGMTSYKIHMGNGSEYHYGPVTNYSIKTNMYPWLGAGWTWGSELATPVAALSAAGDMQIAGAFTATLNLLALGKGGFGMAEASIYGGARLHVKSPSSSPWGITSEALSSRRIIGIGHNGTAGVIAVSYLNGEGFSPMTFETGNATRVTITADGKVGIGSANPNQLLTVNGTIYGKEVKVDLNLPGPDYVFEKSYSLPTLEEVKSYIDQNKHLPEVPSAKEMEKNGVMLGEMNMLLLKKVEELTLYVIELKQRDEAQQKEIEELKLKK